MSIYDLSKLKSKQDEFDSRKQQLLERFVIFRDGLVEGLEEFSKQAGEVGLHGIRSLKRVKDTKEFFEATFSVNSFELVLIATDEAYLTDWASNRIACKALIYNNDSEENTPFIDITVQESNIGAYSYIMSWPTSEGLQQIGGGKVEGKETGLAIAANLINRLYSVEFKWHDKPTLGATRRKAASERRPIGFVGNAD